MSPNLHQKIFYWDEYLVANINQYTIRQGNITLYQRSDEGGAYQSDSWYAAFKVPNQKTIRRSLKTANRFDAEVLAEQMYWDLSEKHKRGLSLTSKYFHLVAQSFLKDLTDKVERESSLPINQQRHKPALLRHKRLIVDKFLIKYFDGKTLHEINDYDVDSYKDWRRNYWTSGEGKELQFVEYKREGRKVRRAKTIREQSQPNWNTVNKELTTLRQIFEFARKKRIISDREIPIIKNVSKPRDSSDRKPSLTEEEVKHLLKTLVERYHSQANPKHKRSHKLLLHYIAWMCLTGIRVAEAKNLTIDKCKEIVKDGKTYLRVFVYGKGKSRELIALDEAITLLNKLIYMHQQNAKLHDWTFSHDQPLFMDQYGKAIGNFAKSLNRAFEEADLLYDVHGVKRSAGAFRKYYITHALLEGNINYFELAKQCGTSVNVIEQYYASIDVTQRPESFIFNNALSGVYDDNPAQFNAVFNQ
jgi:integrase